MKRPIKRRTPMFGKDHQQKQTNFAGQNKFKVHNTNKNEFQDLVLHLTGTTLKQRLEMLPPLSMDNSLKRCRVNRLYQNCASQQFGVSPIMANTQLPPPSPQPSCPMMPSSLQFGLPLSPQEDESMEALVAKFKSNLHNRMVEDHTDQEEFSRMWSSLHLNTNSYVEYDHQQQEHIPPPPVPVSAPRGSLVCSNSSGLRQDVSPLSPVSAPPRSSLWPNSLGVFSSSLFLSPICQSENVPPPVPVNVQHGSVWPNFSGVLLPNLSLCPTHQNVPPPILVSAPPGSSIWSNSSGLHSSSFLLSPIRQNVPPQDLVSAPPRSSACPNSSGVHSSNLLLSPICQVGNVPPPVLISAPPRPLVWPNSSSVLSSSLLMANTQLPPPPPQPSGPMFPPSLQLGLPFSPQEDESMDAWLDEFTSKSQNRMVEDDTNQEEFSRMWSSLPLNTNSFEYHQQREHIPPPLVPVSAPHGSLVCSDSSGLHQNISPPAPVNAPPTFSIWPNSSGVSSSSLLLSPPIRQSENVPPPVLMSAPHSFDVLPSNLWLSPIRQNIPPSIPVSEPRRSSVSLNSLDVHYSGLLLSPICQLGNVPPPVLLSAPPRPSVWPNSSSAHQNVSSPVPVNALPRSSVWPNSSGVLSSGLQLSLTHQSENVRLPVPMSVPNGSLVLPNSLGVLFSSLLMPPLCQAEYVPLPVPVTTPPESSSDALSPSSLLPLVSLSENLSPPVPMSAPHGSLVWPSSSGVLFSSFLISEPSPLCILDCPNLLNNQVPGNSPPPFEESSLFPSIDWSSLPIDVGLENIPLFQETSPFSGLDWLNPPNHVGPENLPPPFLETSLLSSFDYLNPPNVIGPENIPPPFLESSPLCSLEYLNPPNVLGLENIAWPVRETSPLRSQDCPNSPEDIPSPIFLPYATFPVSPTTGLLPNLN